MPVYAFEVGFDLPPMFTSVPSFRLCSQGGVRAFACCHEGSELLPMSMKNEQKPSLP